MAIWLRKEGGIAIEGDVIRREELAALTEIDRDLAGMRQHAARIVDEAQTRAEQIVSDAERQAAEIREAAQKKYEDSARLGYADGSQKAVADVHASMLERSVQDRRALETLRERIASIVMRAVEQTIDGDRAALFKRAAKILSREMADASFLTVTVNPADAEAVRTVFREIGEQMAWPVPANVVEDEQAEKGHCLCEWDYGVLDAGLTTQLKALCSAIRKTIQAGNRPETQDASEAHAGYDAHEAHQEHEAYEEHEGYEEHEEHAVHAGDFADGEDAFDGQESREDHEDHEDAELELACAGEE